MFFISVLYLNTDFLLTFQMCPYASAYIPLFVYLFEAGYLYIALAVLKLIEDQAGLELTEILLPLPSEFWN